MRLQKYLARSGVASRRTSEKYIVDGCVSVNGKIVAELGVSVNEDVDVVEVDGQIVKLIEEKYLLILNKPAGYVTSMHDEQGRLDISLLVDANKYKSVFPVGRLDMDTRGLLLLTNDGQLGNDLMHPKKCVNKTYIARIKGDLDASNLQKLESGIDIGDYVTRPCECKVLECVDETIDPGRRTFLKNKGIAGKGFSDVLITIHEGKNRQVRRMFKAIGKQVYDLVRVSYGNLDLKDVESGCLREINTAEMLALRQHCIV